jgi:hypothetical protein
MVTTGALEGRRLSTKEFMNYRHYQTDPPTPWDVSKNDYTFAAQTISTQFGGTGYVYSESFIDFNGFVQDDLTVFPERVSIQESGSFKMNADATSTHTGAIVLDLMTEERITDFDTLVDNMVILEVAPGFNRGALEFQQIIYGRYRMFGQDSAVFTATTGNLTMINEAAFGSGSPTMARKLWCTRIVIPLGDYVVDANTFIIIPAARYIITYNVTKEADPEYFMRLKRSYELATND